MTRCACRCARPKGLLVAALLLLVAAPPAAADMYKNAVADVKQALAADDDARLTKLARHNAMHAWPVAVELCQEGRFEDALRFARAAQGKVDARFVAFVESCRSWDGDWEALAEIRKRIRNATIRAVDPKTATRAIEELKSIEVPAGAPGTVEARRLFGIAFAYQRLQKWVACAEASDPAIEAARAIGWHARERSALEHAHGSLIYLRRIEEALGYGRRLLELAIASEEPAAVARAEYGVGNLLSQLGRYRESLPHLERAEALYRDVKDADADMRTRALRLQTLLALGEVEASLELAEALVAEMEPDLDQADAAESVLALAQALQRVGRYEEAMAYNNRVVALARKRKDPLQIGLALLARGGLHRLLGDAAAALTDLEDAVGPSMVSGSPVLIRKVRTSLAALHHMVGNKAATDAHLRVAEFWQRMLGDKDPTGRAELLGMRARILEERGEHEDARKLVEASLASHRKANHRLGIANDTGTLGDMESRVGNHDAAVRRLTESRDINRELDDRVGFANASLALGRALLRAGRPDEAAGPLQEATREAEDRAILDVQVGAAATMAELLLMRGNADEALARARTAIDLLPRLVRGHGEEEGTRARSRHKDVYDVGLRAAMATRKPEHVYWMLEASRAGTLRENLAAKNALRRALLPGSVAQAEGLAKFRLQRAREVMRQADRDGNRKALKAARADLREAQRALQQVIERAHREAKAGAALRYPQPDPLDRVRARLRDDEVLLVYGMTSTKGLALVVRSTGARVVSLGPRGAIVEAVEQLHLSDKQAATESGIATLRDLLVKPLALGKSSKHVILSPVGVLADVPFGVLLPERDIAYTPSASTYGSLLQDRELRGSKTLAIGDPAYDSMRQGTVRGLRRSERWRQLEELPATRDEVIAVGDVKLLSDKATVSALLEALPKEARWRSVHFACHGLLDGRYPLLSALALTPSDEDDGLFTCLDVFQARIPADLVVLSACETARGKDYASEGVVGFTRAFMYAGTPRILCSLWKVDDAATKALMVKFYELWRQGTDAAEALRKAQAFVRGHEKWKHPYYWSAWVLWGLGR